MTDPVILWIRGRSPPWPGLAEGLGPGAVLDETTDATSMREVRARAVEVGPDAIVYAGWRDEQAPEDELFRHVAEATIGIAAAAMELGVVACLLSHPAVFSGPGGPWSESDPPQPLEPLGEAFLKAETFLGRAAGGRALVVRAGPVLGRGLEAETAALASGRAAPKEGRRVTPVADRDLGETVRRLVLSGARGVVHVGGPAVEEVELWHRIARAVGQPAPPRARSSGRTSRALARHRMQELGLPPAADWAPVLEAPAGLPSGRLLRGSDVQRAGARPEAPAAQGSASPPEGAPEAARSARAAAGGAPPAGEGTGAPGATEGASPAEGPPEAEPSDRAAREEARPRVEAAAPSPTDPARRGGPERLWTGPLPEGRTALGSGAVAWRLTPGAAAVPFRGAETLVVLEGKVVWEEAEDDRVLRAGHRLALGAEAAGARAVGVEPSTLLFLVGAAP